MVQPIILAIESSCDDTSAAVIAGGRLLSNQVATQEIHEKYGGVIPELASRAHQFHILPVVEQALLKANVHLDQLDAIAFTRGPGLLGSLLVGIMTAKSLALSLDIPLIEVHHMKAHVMAHFIEPPGPQYPFLCLTVSGGHTQIVKVEGPNQMEVLGQTIDDAAGEAFDKIGKMLGLPYPAGPEIDRLAREGQPSFEFSKAQVSDLDFSYSGLKTSVLYFLQKQVAIDPDFIQNNLNDLCASVQSNIVDTLLHRLKQAAESTGIQHLALAGGVSANSHLRSQFHALCESNGWKAYIPAFEYCTDNAGMIAISAHYEYIQGNFAGQEVVPSPRLEM